MSVRVIPANIPPEDWAATPASVRAWIDELSRTVQALEERLRNLEHRLNQNSRNSSQPPALDRKANQARPARRRHRGAKRGHAKMERAWVAQPDQVIEAPLTTCSHCQADLQAVVPEQMVRRQVTELPDVRPLVIETHQAKAHCPFCHALQRGTLPAGWRRRAPLGHGWKRRSSTCVINSISVPSAPARHSVTCLGWT